MTKDLISFNALSKSFGLDRRALTWKYIPRKHWQRMDDVIYKVLPEWWEEFKKNYKK